MALITGTIYKPTAKNNDVADLRVQLMADTPGGRKDVEL